MEFCRAKKARWLIAAVIFNMLLSMSAHAQAKVGVIVPELRAPFKIIFDAVIEGIDDHLNGRTSKLTLNKGYDPNEIKRWIKKENIDSVITLGVLGQRACKFIPDNIRVVHGALLSAPKDTNSHPGVALTPDPKALFSMLKKLDQKNKKVIVVYNPSKNQWIVDLAMRQAAINNVQLVAYKATSIKQAAKIYDEILSGNDHDDIALWLLNDRKVLDSKVVLPFILGKTWKKRIVVFSSAISHVKKGALFSMFPDNKYHGEQLAKLITSTKYTTDASSNKMFPSVGVLQAINKRTADHLGLNLSRSDFREYDVVFPVSH